MSLFSKVIDFLSGGIGEKIIDSVTKYFPPGMSEKEKKVMEEAIRKASREHELKLFELANEEQEEFNKRIKDLEGTAKDLQQSGWPGRVVLFFRGSQRPVWGFGVLFMDIMVFSGEWKLAEISEAAKMSVYDLQSAFWLINLLVLSFLFGERAVKNVLPIFMQKFGGPKAEG